MAREHARPAFDDLMRQLGIPTPWIRFCATWGLIGTCEAVKHNLLVLALNPDLEQRRVAAHEIACAIAATAAVLGGVAR